MKSKTRIIIYRLIPVAVIMGIIFYSSSQPYSEQNLQPLIDRNFQLPDQIVAFLSNISFNYAGQPVSIETKGLPGFIEFFIRKGAHFSVYFALAVFTAWMVRLWIKPPFKVFAVTILLSFLYACTDELHQSFTGDRTPLFHDVMIDTVGAAIGTIIFLSWIRHREKKRLTQ